MSEATFSIPGIDKFRLDILKERLRGITRAVYTAHTSAVAGDIAEFGTGPGYSFMAIAGTMQTCDYMSVKYGLPNRRLLGFDSFVGIPKAALEVDKEAPMVKTGTWGPGRGGTISAEDLLKRASRFLPVERIHLYQGWYKDSLPDIPKDQKLALVHLDCDLYESTIQVLDHLFANDHLSDGCQLLFDDFLENRMSPKMGQRKAWLEIVEKYKPNFTDLGRYGQPCWAFAIHKN